MTQASIVKHLIGLMCVLAIAVPVCAGDGETGTAGWTLANATEGDALGARSGHDHAEAERGGLHFLHPLLAESPSPDSKIRGDYVFAHDGQADEHTVRLEFEHALARWVSVEFDIPYVAVDPDDGSSPSDLGTIEAALKLAWFGLEDRGVVLGGGIELGLPTGDDGKDIGSNNELEIAPFVDAGYKDGPLEIVAFLHFEIPTNEAKDERGEVDLALGYNLALMYHMSRQAAILLEFEGETVASGDEEESVLNIGPGLIVTPDPDRPLMIGVGVSWPVTQDEEFDFRSNVSVFWHF